WQASPFRHMLETKTRRLHRRLVGEGAVLDFLTCRGAVLANLSREKLNALRQTSFALSPSRSLSGIQEGVPRSICVTLFAHLGYGSQCCYERSARRSMANENCASRDLKY